MWWWFLSLSRVHTAFFVLLATMLLFHHCKTTALLCSFIHGSWQRHIVRCTAFSLARCRHRHMSQKMSVRNALCRSHQCSSSVEQSALLQQQKVPAEVKPFHVKGNGEMEIDDGPPPRTVSADLLRSLQPCISTLNRRGAPRGKTYERRHCSPNIKPLCKYFQLPYCTFALPVKLRNNTPYEPPALTTQT